MRVEYAVALIYCSEAGQREATIGFDVGQGTQDLGFRGEVPILFEVRPAIPVRLAIHDHDGTPTVGRFTFTDRSGRRLSAPAQAARPRLLLPGAGLSRTMATSFCSPADRDDLWPRAGVSAAKSQTLSVPDARRAEASTFGSSAGSTPRTTAFTAATTTFTPRAVLTTPARPRGPARGHVPAGQGRRA